MNEEKTNLREEKIPPHEFPHNQPDFYTQEVTIKRPKMVEGKKVFDDDGFIVEEEVKDSYKNVYTRLRSIKEHFSDPDKHLYYDEDEGILLAYRFEDDPVLIHRHAHKVKNEETGEIEDVLEERIIARHLNRGIYITLDKKYAYFYDHTYKDALSKYGGLLLTYLTIEELKDILNQDPIFENDLYLKKQLIDECLNNFSWVSYLDEPKDQFYGDN